MDEFLISRRQLVAGLGTLGAATALASMVQAGPAEQPATPAGSWFAEFIADDGRTFRGFSTFAPGGGMISTGQGDYRQDSPQGTGHGKWVQDGRRVDAKILKFVFNAEGQLAAIKEEFSTGEMDESGDGFIGSTTVKTYDLEGNLIEERTGTINSRRITLDPIFGNLG
jgi:hypothetical protein